MIHGHRSRLDERAGVERLQMVHTIGGRSLMWVSVYRVGDTLIDSGCSWGRPILERYLREHPVSSVLTTHEHEDHVGNHEVIQADMYAPGRAVQLLHEGPPRLPPYRWVTWGAHGKAPQARKVPDSLKLGERSWSIIPTPGHSADHVAYLDETSGAVFTGDAYLGKLKAIRAKENLPVQMASIRRIADADPSALYPAHGMILERPRAKLLEVADHFDRLREKARALSERGLTPRRIRQELMGPEPSLTYVSLGAFSSENLIRSLL